MENIKKQAIVATLLGYIERKGSGNKAANSMKGVSSATVNQMVNGNWDLISDEMWLNVSKQIGHSDSAWVAVETRDYVDLTGRLDFARKKSQSIAIVGNAGSGKTFALKKYACSTPHTYLLSCNEFWGNKMFLQELMSVMGMSYGSMTQGEMMRKIIVTLRKKDQPIVILDEADKLNDRVLYFFISLYNQLEDADGMLHCGLVMCATHYLARRLKRGNDSNKKGFEEIWSRLGSNCIELKGVGSDDIVAVCEANGVRDRKVVSDIIKNSDSDLRRVKRLIFAVKQPTKG